MVVAFTDEEKSVLYALLERGQENGIENLRIVDADEARQLEPSLASEVRAALVAPTGGICDPYEMALRALENAVSNGVRIEFGAKVTSLSKVAGGWEVATRKGRILCRAVINAAGVYADEINNMVGAPRLRIIPIKGEYALYDTVYGSVFSHTMFQVPSRAGKGVLVSPTVHGNLFIGPNSHPQTSKEDRATSREGLAEIKQKARIPGWQCLPRGL